MFSPGSELNKEDELMMELQNSLTSLEPNEMADSLKDLMNIGDLTDGDFWSSGAPPVEQPNLSRAPSYQPLQQPSFPSSADSQALLEDPFAASSMVAPAIATDKYRQQRYTTADTAGTSLGFGRTSLDTTAPESAAWEMRKVGTMPTLGSATRNFDPTESRQGNATFDLQKRTRLVTPAPSLHATLQDSRMKASRSNPTMMGVVQSTNHNAFRGSSNATFSKSPFISALAGATPASTRPGEFASVFSSSSAASAIPTTFKNLTASGNNSDNRNNRFGSGASGLLSSRTGRASGVMSTARSRSALTKTSTMPTLGRQSELTSNQANAVFERTSKRSRLLSDHRPLQKTGPISSLAELNASTGHLPSMAKTVTMPSLGSSHSTATGGQKNATFDFLRQQQEPPSLRGQKRSLLELHPAATTVTSSSSSSTVPPPKPQFRIPTTFNKIPSFRKTGSKRSLSKTPTMPSLGNKTTAFRRSSYNASSSNNVSNWRDAPEIPLTRPDSSLVEQLRKSSTPDLKKISTVPTFGQRVSTHVTLNNATFSSQQPQTSNATFRSSAANAGASLLGRTLPQMRQQQQQQQQRQQQQQQQLGGGGFASVFQSSPLESMLQQSGGSTTRRQQPKQPTPIVAQSRPPRLGAAAGGTQQQLQPGVSLLHQSCRLFPRTASVIESAVQVDPTGVSRRVPTSNGDHVSIHQKQDGVSSDAFSFPLNIALHHRGSLEVVKLLAQAAPQVLTETDGPELCGSLGIAIYHRFGLEVTNLLLETNPQCIQVVDRYENYPLHIACFRGSSIEVVERLYQAHPDALMKKNFNGQLPLEVAQQCSSCPEAVVNFLQEETLQRMEATADSDVYPNFH